VSHDRIGVYCEIHSAMLLDFYLLRMVLQAASIQYTDTTFKLRIQSKLILAIPLKKSLITEFQMLIIYH
jgi:hypothetical protein